jgi:hypothetical protein
MYAAVLGILMAVGLCAGIVLPPAMGYVAKRATVRAGISLGVAVAALLTAVQAIFLAYERRRLPKSSI